MIGVGDWVKYHGRVWRHGAVGYVVRPPSDTGLTGVNFLDIAWRYSSAPKVYRNVGVRDVDLGPHTPSEEEVYAMAMAELTV